MSLLGQRLDCLKGEKIAHELLNYINRTGSPYHSVHEIVRLLGGKGFEQLDEAESWKLQRGKGYYIVRNSSAVAAFVVGNSFSTASGGISIVAAHTDSPCLRIKPNHNSTKNEYLQIEVECYGGGLWHTWFDRGLGIAGKAVKRLNPTGELEEVLVRIDRPILILPNLAIHLQTAEERAAFKPNKEEHLRPIISSVVIDNLTRGVSSPDGVATSKEQAGPLLDLLSRELSCAPEDIVDLDLCLMDATPGRLCGVYNEFVESPRLDNLVSTFAAFKALSDHLGECSSDAISLAVSFDHEEVGSTSWTGADSSAMEGWLQRIIQGLDEPEADIFRRVMSRSFLLSADMAHGVHPNYPEKHQKKHQPHIHKGIVLKENSNQRYTSECTGMAITRALARRADVPVQNFTVKNDSPCGSTVGPMLSSRLGIRGVDLGICQWAMHSCRECCGVEDILHLNNLFAEFYKGFRTISCKSPM